ncbi:hypothetical protein CPB84DRAFT_1841121 [Gymnopilus junonius]|uniref:DUF4470 domain-containing protein n=1 Tax=Gymnopilus junonius TaxID=109634 RepID=A0A9P5TUP7_GYMJU|nr:hypothetical protein CPB84DRAFT_1841121 [Gymnopilus junonius]
MLHPVNWPKKSFFYPVGSTTPVSFTQTLSPELKADILLLGCGDPRSILYTIHADLAPKYRQMDFTCCDWEPAVLARNMLLFTMIDDSVPISNIWCIFYHFFLDQHSYDVLLAQCRTLFQSSSDMNTWKKSKYGKYLRFCTQHSLDEIRRHWSLLLDMNSLTDRQKEDLKSSFVSGMKSVRDKYSTTNGSFRAAGPLFLSFLSHSASTHKIFWSSGVLSSHLTSNTSHPHVNPTFAYCQGKKQFNVHYGTDPLQCFFLAPTLANISNTRSAYPPTIEHLVESALDQFSSWCSSFKTRLSSDTSSEMTIRFFVGEALAFGHALQVCRIHQLTKTSIYTQPWGGSQIEFDCEDYGRSSRHPAPLTFNVIDTSNLADHAGLINLLVAAVPLLQQSPCSVLHTNTLLRCDLQGSPVSGLTGKTFADIPTLCLLLGVAPTPYLSHFTTVSNKHEIAVSSFSSGQLLDPISWRISSSPIPCSPMQDTEPDLSALLVCGAEHLGKFLFSVYLQMFSEEDMYNNLENRNQETVQKQVTPHYTRAGLACLFGFIKDRVETDWPLVTLTFFRLFEQDRTLTTGFNNYQDLLCELYIRDLHFCYYLSADHLRSQRKGHNRFAGWKELPSVVCVVLKVPRAYLKRLEDIDLGDSSVPILNCTSKGPQSHNIFSSIRPMFGDITISRNVAGEPQVDIIEDSEGWMNNSPLIVTFYMPTWIILKNNPETFSIGLNIRANLRNAALFAPKFGLELSIYSTKLTDMEHIQIVRHRPGNIGEIARLRSTSALVNLRVKEHPTVMRKVKLDFDGTGTRATTLTMRHDVNNLAAQALSGGASVTLRAVSDTSMMVTFGNYKRLFVYPFPICGKQTKCRVARKSSYIEIEAPIRPSYDDFVDFSLNPFPVIVQNGAVNVLNMHYVNMDILPALQGTALKGRLEWIPSHLGFALSEREKQAIIRAEQQERGALVNVKKTITLLFSSYLGLSEQGPYTPFGLSDPTDGLYVLIFVNDIKFDLPSHTVVIDACVVPLNDSIMDTMTPKLGGLASSGFLKIITHNNETRAWKSLFPALAERCRTWKHLPNCEYLSTGIPVTLEGSNGSPLCSCGTGKNLGSFGGLIEWKVFYEEATRIAIGPLFTSSFMQDNTDTVKGSITSSLTLCNNCRGPGKPKLLICTRFWKRLKARATGTTAAFDALASTANTRVL